ncbi:hypothetical protein GCM10023086_21140 [Streptomyces venetus]|uniref:Uncharacterized protein n=1 Tax=Streptomyces venetus TaxID=1701086 RepID=A0ABP8FHV4_9ACTN
MSLGIGAVMPPTLTETDIAGDAGRAVWVTPSHVSPPPPSPARLYSRPTNVSNVASGGHANRTGV